MSNKVKSLIIAAFLGLTALIPASVSAQAASSSQLLQRLQTVAGMGGYQTDTNVASTPKIIGTVIGVLLGFLGVVFLVLMIIAGYNWMTAAGNEQQVEKSKNTIKQAVIGLIVAVSAWSIWSFVFQRFVLLAN